MEVDSDYGEIMKKSRGGENEIDFSEQEKVAVFGSYQRTEMKILSWNCRGMGNRQTVRVLSDWCWRYRPNIVFFSEIMLIVYVLGILRKKTGRQKRS